MKKSVLAAALLMSTSCFSDSCCVARGTIINTPRGPRRVEDLEVGDIVYAYNEETGERFETPIVFARSAHREVGRVAVGGHVLNATSDHPLYCPVDRVYAPAGDWFLGHRSALAVLGESGFETKSVERAEVYVEVTEVFDIGVAHDLHNFVANGVLVHNKSVDLGPYECVVDGKDVEDGDFCDCTVFIRGRIDCDTETCACDEPIPDVGADAADRGSSADMAPRSDALSDSGGDQGVSDMAVDMADMTTAGRHRGTCMVDADCARPNWSCITIPADDPNGFHTCQPDVAAPPNCATIEAPDTCCVHADCNQADPSGTCVIGPIFYCGGVQPIIANVCLYDECAADADCGADEICVPPRVLAEPVARCAPAECRTDADCDSRAGGECTEFFDPCNGRFSGFFCTYDDSVCRTGTDCPDDPAGPVYCSPGMNEGETTCQVFQPPP